VAPRDISSFVHVFHRLRLAAAVKCVKFKLFMFFLAIKQLLSLTVCDQFFSVCHCVLFTWLISLVGEMQDWKNLVFWEKVYLVLLYKEEDQTQN